MPTVASSSQIDPPWALGDRARDREAEAGALGGPRPVCAIATRRLTFVLAALVAQALVVEVLFDTIW